MKWSRFVQGNAGSGRDVFSGDKKGHLWVKSTYPSFGSGLKGS